MKYSKKSKITSYILLSLIILPFILGFGYAFCYSVGITGLMSKGFTLSYWKTMLSHSHFFKSLIYSLYISVLSLGITVVLSFHFCWHYINHPKRFNLFILIIPLTFPPLVVTLAMYYILSPTGVIARMLFTIGIEDLSFLPRMVNDTFGIGVIVSHIYIVFPILSLIAIYISKKENILHVAQSAYSLGASKSYFFYQTFIPLMYKKMIFFLLLYFIFLLNAYEIPLQLGQTSPNMLTIYIIELLTKFNWRDIPLGYTASTIYCILLFFILFLVTRKKRGILW